MRKLTNGIVQRIALRRAKHLGSTLGQKEEEEDKREGEVCLARQTSKV
jgi:hypothetical protein